MMLDVASDTLPNRAYRGTVAIDIARGGIHAEVIETPDLRTDLVYRLRIIMGICQPGVAPGHADNRLCFPRRRWRKPFNLNASAPIDVRSSVDLVRLSRITKRFGTALPALDAVSGIDVGSGEITGLVGPPTAPASRR